MKYGIYKNEKAFVPVEVRLSCHLNEAVLSMNDWAKNHGGTDWLIRDESTKKIVYHYQPDLVKEQAVTEDGWYSKTEKPPVFDVYEIRYLKAPDGDVDASRARYSYWNGKYWCEICYDIQQAKDSNNKSRVLYNNQYDWQWRPIVKEEAKVTEDEKLSVIYDGKIKPSVPGVYKVTIKYPRASSTFFSYWNGKEWMGTADTAASAREMFSVSEDLKSLPFTWELVEMDNAVDLDWHNKDEKPTVVGTYEIEIKFQDCREKTEYSYWNGEYWCCAVLHPEQAKSYSHSMSRSLYSNEFEWRWKLFQADKIAADKTSMEPAPEMPKTAADFLNRAIELQAERAKQYDAGGQQERSMAKTVDAFNAICGHSTTCGLDESHGWLFMCLLKMVRSESKFEPHPDSIEDLVSYASLYAEARANRR